MGSIRRKTANIILFFLFSIFLPFFGGIVTTFIWLFYYAIVSNVVCFGEKYAYRYQNVYLVRELSAANRLVVVQVPLFWCLYFPQVHNDKSRYLDSSLLPAFLPYFCHHNVRERQYVDDTGQWERGYMVFTLVSEEDAASSRQSSLQELWI